ncbi:LPS assembly protein LptD [Salinivibrio proteolyticus]|uniref:LPS assembly protein LptD n=1 Tax=Salinivibrio proteolyticus TaxID=334715 RepID=UPI000988F235|nr:LPS assembly protein LptD [Salinivibrio proteolyticus]OOF26835.1 LPS assembly protein LptD [Salinivibrio proteolyticus]
MSPTARSFLATMISLALYGPALAFANADSADKPCPDSEARCIPPSKQTQDVNNAPIRVVADRAEAQSNEKAIYSGNVEVTQGHRKMTADTATLRDPERIVTAQGDVVFNDGQMMVTSDYLQANLDTEDTTLNNAQYKMLCTPGRGEAKRVFKNGTTFYEMEDGTFTTCPDEDKSWRFSASKIEKEEDSLFADLYHPKFEVMNVPVFYLPYLRVPVEDGRLTGFLYPSVSWSDRDGVELETPFYWNIHPQLDATITPKYMSERGVQLNTNIRYLAPFGYGSLYSEYLPDDQLNPELDERWGFNWKHSGVQGHWRYEADYSKVSDIAYFQNIDSDVGKREDNTLLQTGEISYRGLDWNSTVRVRDFQALTENTSVYRLMPQVDLNYYAPQTLGWADISLPAQLSVFASDDPNKPEATRTHLAPTLSIPFTRPWFSATAEASMLYTHYDQRFNNASPDAESTAKLSKSVERKIPTLRLHSGLVLERNFWAMGSNFSQTLEPQVQYLYIKDVNQSDIYNPVNYNGGGYDTARLQTDYYGLFRGNQFSSIDFINPANQLTYGATTRFYDSGYKERFNLSFGQIYYFDRSSDDDVDAFDYSAWALEGEANFNDNFFVRGSMQYDSNLSELQFGNAIAEYRQSGFYAQTSYRYVAQDYIVSTLPNRDISKLTDDGLSQAGIVTGFPLWNGLSFKGQYWRDLTQDVMLENQFSLTYRSDCWVIGLSYNEYLLSRSNINSDPEYDNNVTLSFSLLGLGAQSGFNFSTDSGNALGYRDPFALKN